MQEQLHAAANRFTSPFASVIFNEEGAVDVTESERRSVERALTWVASLEPRALRAIALQMDRILVPAMSGPSMLRLGRLIEEKSPAVIGLMPRLSRHHAHLTRAAEIARIFSPAALERLARALREETNRT